MRKAILLRYTLNPFLYTLFSEVHQNGGTVVRSLTHEFPKDKGTFNIDEQFLWGSSLLISPVIYQSTTVIEAYFPPQARWYSYYDGREVTSTGYNKLVAPRDFIPLHVRGGSVKNICFFFK
jgi:alpha-glucosidase (family GH31 glycosyl hydrolase)